MRGVGDKNVATKDLEAELAALINPKGVFEYADISVCEGLVWR